MHWLTVSGVSSSLTSEDHAQHKLCAPWQDPCFSASGALFLSLSGWSNNKQTPTYTGWGPHWTQTLSPSLSTKMWVSSADILGPLECREPQLFVGTRRPSMSQLPHLWNECHIILTASLTKLLWSQTKQCIWRALEKKSTKHYVLITWSHHYQCYCTTPRDFVSAEWPK